ncbi:hypothetical protein FHS26_005686 [Rhizobium pisi]|uniref:Guanylate cyclase domain-containing protein n=1 Tax=Rhizobium pisi TaxID=574561 RepID=A0A7W5BSH5_9HYPH|nr:adenylate/guanylate cyclase domain-containing protein [Rhizobium pisi]MBB3137918.1 hypothetical protein [Rhizobium pisi]
MRKAVIEPETAKRRGCIFKLIGDGLLAEFGSVVDAVECAVSLQRALDERNADVPQNERLELRIGLNLGEVVVDGDDRYGEGVNASVRLQPLADPGGICISGNVVSEVEETLALGFESMDEATGQEHCRADRGVPPRAGRHFPEMRLATPPALPNKPSIAVLAFENMGGDPEREYFADGLVQDAIANLSKIPSLFAIRAKLQLRLQRQDRRRQADRPRAGRPLRAGRQYPASGKPAAHYRTADRGGGTQPISGSTDSRVRPKTFSTCRIS